MVYGFIQQSGGAIQVRSKLGEGTALTIYLPLVRLQNAGDIGESENKASLKYGSGELLLLIEDDPDVSKTIADQLQNLGFAILKAENADDARQLALDLPELRAVLSDIIMPGQTNGLKLAREIRQNRPELGIALMTGYADWSALADNSSNCEFPVLAKPFNDYQLAETLRKILQP
jgi:DNA-binding NtrC family response regulator